MAFPKQYGIESLSTVSRILGNIYEEMFRELEKEERAGHFRKGFLRIHETTLNTFMISLA